MTALTYLTGITALTPIKVAWVALTLLNVLMMLWIGIRNRETLFGAYMWFMAFVALIQGARSWDLAGEVWLAILSSAWVFVLLPRDKYGRIFALAIGLLITCVLMLAVPPPWPHYSSEMYYTRLYSTAAFLGIAFGAALITRNPSTMIAVPWFMAVIFAGSQRGFDRWQVGIYTNAMWTLCLFCWLAMARRASPASSSTPDVQDADPRSARYLP